MDAEIKIAPKGLFSYSDIRIEFVIRTSSTILAFFERCLQDFFFSFAEDFER